MSAHDEFTEEQKQYLQGFAAGANIAQAVGKLAGSASISASAAPALPAGSGPETIHLRAQDRFVAAGKKLVAEEKAKRDKNPFDIWDDLRANAERGQFPKGTDVFLYKYHGLFYVAPAQDAFMCRLRIPNGILSTHQFRGVADLAQRFGGGYVHVTTRANLQIREIRAEHGLHVVEGLCEIGLTSRGSGADNIRNVTSSPTAGIDPQECIDTRTLGREWHHYILNHREFYGLPRKFNVAFDGGGTVSALEDTNDIGFAAMRVGSGKAAPEGVYFRLLLGGITGHGDFARDSGVLVRPEQCTPVAAAVVRVFIQHGDRTDRKKARLKYLLESWGHEKFLVETERELGYSLPKLNLSDCEPRGPVSKHAHIGVHAQRQAGLSYVGVGLPVGRLTVAQMRGLAETAQRHGGGTIRLTVWQNLLVSDIPTDRLAAVKQEIEALGLRWSVTPIRAGLVACTGSTGCRFSASDTKAHALAIADHMEPRVALDLPINIHLTGCPHSCAQHYIGDIGLLGTLVEVGEKNVEAYHVYAGGAYGVQAKLGRELFRDVTHSQVPQLIESMLRCYLAHRASPSESFREFAGRHEPAQLRAMIEEVRVGDGAGGRHD